MPSKGYTMNNTTLQQRIEQMRGLLSTDAAPASNSDIAGGGFILAVDNTNTVQHNEAVINEIGKQIIMGLSVPLHKAYNMLNHDALTLQHRKKLADTFGMNASELKTAFAGFARNEVIRSALDVVPENEYEFVEALLKKWDTKMTFQKVYTIDTPFTYEDVTLLEADLAEFEEEVQVFIRSADPKTMNFKDMMERVIRENSLMDMGYNEAKVIRAVEYWTNMQQNIIIAQAKKEVTYNPRIAAIAESEWDKLVNAITDINVVETKGVLKHFIWQAKRKMFSKSVDKHMMPVLNGLQEIGKSTIVKQLCSPIKDFTVMTNFKDITDGRDHELWKNYVLILDEMGNSTQSNIEEIKQKITGDTFSPRVMKTNSNTLIVNNSTMIGTTNKDLSTLIFDDTGMRRFFQIACKTAFDWNVTNNIDYLMLWKSINEHADSVLVVDKELAAKIKTIQSVTRYRGIIEEFFRSRDYEKINVAEMIGSTELYQEFQQYELIHDQHGKMAHNKFARDLINIPSKIPGLLIEKLPRSNKGERFRIVKTVDGEFA